MSIGLHCDGPDCDTWTTDEQGFSEWVIVTFVNVTKYFCCGWCMTKWGADRFSPTEVIE